MALSMGKGEKGGGWGMPVFGVLSRCGGRAGSDARSLSHDSPVYRGLVMSREEGAGVLKTHTRISGSEYGLRLEGETS